MKVGVWIIYGNKWLLSMAQNGYRIYMLFLLNGGHHFAHWLLFFSSFGWKCSYVRRSLWQKRACGVQIGSILHAARTGSVHFIWISNLITREVFNHPHFYLFDINMLIDRLCWPAWSLQDREKLIKTTRDYSSHHLPWPCRFLYYTAW